MSQEFGSQARFVKTATKAEQYPLIRNEGGEILPEMAFAGRSNVGKSSLINHLFRSGKLAKVSSTPGKTQALQFFVIENRLSFVDLPGYGYAKVSKSIHTSWDRMIHQYIQTRDSLHLFLLLHDIRRTPGPEDLQFVQWCQENKKKLVIVCTKADKVSKTKRTRDAEKLREQLGCPEASFILYSTVKNIGRSQLIATLKQELLAE